MSDLKSESVVPVSQEAREARDKAIQGFVACALCGSRDRIRLVHLQGFRIVCDTGRVEDPVRTPSSCDWGITGDDPHDAVVRWNDQQADLLAFRRGGGHLDLPKGRP